MAYLQQLPIDEIKIDGSFVEGLPGNENDAAIVRAIISLARSLNCIVYAEGVERADQAQWLVKEDCNVLQGMVVSAPIAGPEFEACLAKRETQHDVRF